MINGGDLATKAYWLLRTEFDRALGESPAMPISTPATEGHEERPLVDVVCDLFLYADTDHMLLLDVLAALHSTEDRGAQAAVQGLAHRFACEQTQTLAALGCFEEDLEPEPNID